jgi:hypothetical protein
MQVEVEEAVMLQEEEAQPDHPRQDLKEEEQDQEVMNQVMEAVLQQIQVVEEVHQIMLQEEVEVQVLLF